MGGVTGAEPDPASPPTEAPPPATAPAAPAGAPEDPAQRAALGDVQAQVTLADRLAGENRWEEAVRWYTAAA